MNLRPMRARQGRKWSRTSRRRFRTGAGHRCRVPDRTRRAPFLRGEHAGGFFFRATEEARELFRAGQKQRVLSRQAGEAMLSYVSRRRRWRKLLRTLDKTIELSEPLRVELLLKLSGLTRQETLVVKACARRFQELRVHSQDSCGPLLRGPPPRGQVPRRTQCKP